MSVPVLTHRRDLRQGDLVFPEEILRIGHTLDFQLGCVSKEVQQEVFGPELDTSSLCDWLNLHTAYDFALQDVAEMCIRDSSSVLDFLRRAACFLFLQQQYYKWGQNNE